MFTARFLETSSTLVKLSYKLFSPPVRPRCHGRRGLSDVSTPAVEGTGRISPNAGAAWGRLARRRATPFACARSPSARKWQRTRWKARHRGTPYEFSDPLCSLFYFLPSKRRSTLSPGAGHCSTRSRLQPLRRISWRPFRLPGLHSDHPRASSQSGSACPRRAECAQEAGSCRLRRVRPPVHLPPMATRRGTNSKARQSLCQPIFLCMGCALRMCRRGLLWCDGRSPRAWV
jgi:hypothetical protein